MGDQIDGNLAALTKYEQEVEQREQEWEAMIAELREAQIVDAPAIIDNYGYGDVDIVDILSEVW